MARKDRSFPLLVAVAVVALVLGSFGTAVAGSALTKSQVKKIAAKVVKKAAPKLSVAQATNATKLGGQDPAAYLNQSFRYRLPVQAPASERIYSFPGLPGGTYAFTYNVIMFGSDNSTFCELRPSAVGGGSEGYSNATGIGRLNASGIIQFTGNTVNLRCDGGSLTVYNGTDTLSSVTFTRIDTLTEGTATAP